MAQVLSSKQELIDWISTIEDPETLMILKGIKHEATFNFDEELKKSIPVAEARKRSLENIRKIWKK